MLVVHRGDALGVQPQTRMNGLLYRSLVWCL